MKIFKLINRKKMHNVKNNKNSQRNKTNSLKTYLIKFYKIIA